MNNNRRVTLKANQNIIVEFADERIIFAAGGATDWTTRDDSVNPFDPQTDHYKMVITKTK